MNNVPGSSFLMRTLLYAKPACISVAIRGLQKPLWFAGERSSLSRLELYVEVKAEMHARPSAMCGSYELCCCFYRRCCCCCCTAVYLVFLIKRKKTSTFHFQVIDLPKAKTRETQPAGHRSKPQPNTNTAGTPQASTFPNIQREVLTAEPLYHQLPDQTLLHLHRQVHILQHGLLEPEVCELQMRFLENVAHQGYIELILIHRLEYLGEHSLQPRRDDIVEHRDGHASILAALPSLSCGGCPVPVSGHTQQQQQHSKGSLTAHSLS